MRFLSSGAAPCSTYGCLIFEANKDKKDKFREHKGASNDGQDLD
jgi:hypothetical protein